MRVPFFVFTWFLMGFGLWGCPFTEQNKTPLPLNSTYAIYFSQVQKSKIPGAENLDQHLCAFLAQAQKSLELAVFEIDLPCVQDILKAAKRRGIQVRIVTDTDYLSQVKGLIQQGVALRDDQRSAFMHNKFVIRDQRWVWTGSFNFTANDAYKNNNNALWLDSVDLAKNYLKEFDEMFERNEFGPRSRADTPQSKIQVGAVQIENYFSPEDQPQNRLLELIQGAKKSVHFMAFSFTDDKLGELLVQKAAAGVEVRGLFEKRGTKTKHSEYSRLKQAKIPVHLDGNPDAMHHKVVIIDGRIVWTGSYNFSQNAQNNNDENILILHHPSIAKEYEKEFERLYDLGE